MDCSKPGVFELSLLDLSIPLFLGIISQFEQSPVLKRSSTISGQDEKDWNPNEGDQIERKKEDKLDDLSEAEW